MAHRLQLQWNVERRARAALWRIEALIEQMASDAHRERSASVYSGMKAIDEAYNLAMLHTSLPRDMWVGVELDRGVIRRFIPVTA